MSLNNKIGIGIACVSAFICFYALDKVSFYEKDKNNLQIESINMRIYDLRQNAKFAGSASEQSRILSEIAVLEDNRHYLTNNNH